ncbi:MAG TPA: TetR/AcrR family transcriptional regulator [Pseudolysinimonas sp.]
MASEKQPRADAVRNRAAIVDAARAVFDAGEFFDLRFDDFAGRAGVGTGTLYRHFPTREALAAAVYENEIATLAARAGELRDTLPAGEALDIFVRDMVDHMRSHEGLARTLAAMMTAGSSDVRAASSEPLERAVAELVTAAAREGSIRSDVRPGAVMMALHSLGAAYDRPDWRAETDEFITVMLNGLRAR